MLLTLPAPIPEIMASLPEYTNGGDLIVSPEEYWSEYRFPEQADLLGGLEAGIDIFAEETPSPERGGAVDPEGFDFDSWCAEQMESAEVGNVGEGTWEFVSDLPSVEVGQSSPDFDFPSSSLTTHSTLTTTTRLVTDYDLFLRYMSTRGNIGKPRAKPCGNCSQRGSECIETGKKSCLSCAGKKLKCSGELKVCVVVVGRANTRWLARRGRC